MIFEVNKRMFNGIAWGGLITFIALSILLMNDVQTDVYTIWLYIGSSMMIGIYYGISSFIFTLEKWSALKKTLVQSFTSIAAYLVISLTSGSVPILFAPIMSTCLFFIVWYFIFWTGYNIYYKKTEKSLNNSLSKK